jgi:hypothetical protein
MIWLVCVRATLQAPPEDGVATDNLPRVGKFCGPGQLPTDDGTSGVTREGREHSLLLYGVEVPRTLSLLTVCWQILPYRSHPVEGCYNARLEEANETNKS